MATSGENEHPIISFTGRPTDSVGGLVFDVSKEELERADEYEVKDYKRIQVKLASGLSAWVYVQAESK
ncbi:gamma-glutamylcyclotransferase [Legionella longbeachae]|uniref:gamma-glutamylcyclotransferase n=1 Tax=Legionella longbeachae TaxID=450 RepID=UPI00299F5301|nr:gamma-glutamylcyclotransferase [Legionella longbeachae]